MPRSIAVLLLTCAVCAAQPIPRSVQRNAGPTEEALSARLQQDPNNIPLLLQMGSMKLEDMGSLHGDARSAVLDESQSYYERVVALDSQNTNALYSLGVIGWTKVFAALRAARAQLGMEPETPGPLRDRDLRAVLNGKYAQVINDSIADLDRVLSIDPQNNDSMAYLNLLYRSKADLEETPEASRQDIVTADGWVQKTLATVRAKHASGVPLNPPFATAPPPPPPPPPPAGTPARIRVGSNVQEANLVQHVDPVYPPLAQQARIQGTVRFNATIARDGTIANLQVLSGHPMLVQSALEAVKRWAYKPTLLNGEPVEVMTTIDVKFALP